MKNYKVHSLERGLELIEILAEGPAEQSLTEISQKADFNPTTAHRLLNALKSTGYVKQNPENSSYGLTMKLFDLGQKVFKKTDLRERVIPALRRITERTQETSYLFIRDGYDALCIERILTPRKVKVYLLDVGDRIPLHVGAASRILLAYQSKTELAKLIDEKVLSAPSEWSESISQEEVQTDLDRIRKNGYAVFDYQNEGARAIGCPVKDNTGSVFASISIFGMADKLKQEERVDEIVEIMNQELERIFY